MLRATLTTALLSLSTSAFAHGGHIADVGHGHSHFEGISALVLVGIITTFFAVKRFNS